MFQVESDHKTEFIDCPEFHDSTRADEILGMWPPVAEACSFPVLTAEEEFHYFRQFNFLKFMASRSESAESQQLVQRSIEVRNFLLCANLRLVWKLCRRPNRSEEFIRDSIQSGTICLIRALELFNFTLGTRFSKYAWVSIRRSIIVMAGNERTHQASGTDSDHDPLRGLIDTRCNGNDERTNTRQAEIIRELLKSLPNRERIVLTSFYGLNGKCPESMTEIGKLFSVTGGAISLTHSKALRMLRPLVDRYDIPGFEGV